jgi:hypothetical protein
MSEYSSIVTHNDFDGLGSAALISWAFDIEDIRFAGPITIAKAEIPITGADIVCDLPYPLECGMWFDHHTGNLAELELRGLDMRDIPGRFAPAPSCVRVIHDYLVGEGDVPEDYAELAREADTIDSFSYPDIAAWRAETPANTIDRAIRAASTDRREQEDFLREVVFLMRDMSLSDTAREPSVANRAIRYAHEEEIMLEHIRRFGRVLEQDAAGEMVVVDLTLFPSPVKIDKKLIGLIFPAARCYMEMKNVFRGGQKTNDLSLSLSLSLAMQREDHTKDVGDIVRDLNIGDGHAGASAGVLRCATAHECQKARDEMPLKILEMWRKQG